jgi:predicted metalloprotease with PDZ domain
MQYRLGKMACVKTWIILGALALAGAAQADIEYVVTLNPTPGTIHVTMYVPNTEKGSKFQIPNWAPGAYRLNDTFNNVKNLTATDPAGQALRVDTVMTETPLTYGDAPNRTTIQNKICTWVVSGARSTKVDYDLNLAAVDNVMHWSGPSTYMYEVDRKEERCSLEIKMPSDWKAYTGMDEMTFRPNTYTADTYDVLADNPVTAGSNLIVDTYKSWGKPHYIVMRGAPKSKVNREYLIKACKFVSDMEGDFFGGNPPYHKYIWHFLVNDAADGAGGLEHLSSTQISLASGVGPGAVSVLAHEFFHLWNVKRIRSRVLGPFDYTKLPETGALWWLEGVTDYYASYLLYRYGWSDEKWVFDEILQNTNGVRRLPAHNEVSPHDASFRVNEASNGRGNSNGWRMSYYNQGWLVGMVLDIELRSQTNGRYSLDDVERALWKMTKDSQPGFAEDEIRTQLVKFGGAKMGVFYDRVAMKPGDMALEETLAKAGLTLATKQEQYLDYGFTWGGGFRTTGISVRSVGASAEGKLAARDQITAVNGVKLEGATQTEMSAQMTKIMDGVKAGDAIKLSVMRGEQAVEVELKAVMSSRPVMSIEKVANPTSAQKKLRDAWMARKSVKA